MPETVFVSEYSYARGRRVFEALNAEGEMRFVAVEDAEAAKGILQSVDTIYAAIAAKEAS